MIYFGIITYLNESYTEMNGNRCFVLTDNIIPQTMRNNCIYLTQRHLMILTVKYAVDQF